MKIKHDYVTNSSSTCFILALPENYKPDRKEVILAIEESYIWKTYKLKCLKDRVILVSLIYSGFDDMKYGHNIIKWVDGDIGESDSKLHLHKFEAILVLTKDLTLTEIEMASEHGEDRILSVSAESIEKAFFRNNSEKLTKTLKKIVQEDDNE